MACRTICRICPRIAISQNIAVSGTDLAVNIPAGSYEDGMRYCIVTAQAIPTAATIDMPVVVTIGEGTVTYPLIQSNGAQVTARMLRTRTRYATRVATNATGGVFRLLGGTCPYMQGETLGAIDGTAPVILTTPGATGKADG